MTGKYLKKLLLFKRSRGAILFLAVGSLAVLSILAIAATSSVTQELKLARIVADSDSGHLIARSVIDAMKIAWSADATPGTVTLYDLRSRDILFVDKIGHVNFLDEGAKINIAKASAVILSRLPGLAGETSLIDAIVAAKPSVKEGLLLLPGMEQERYDLFKDIVTVCGEGSVNINTASAVVLSVLGVGDVVFEKIRLFRNGDDGLEATEDDKFFSDPAEIVPRLESYGLDVNQKMILEGLVASGQLGTTSSYIRFGIEVKRAGKVLKNFDIIVDIKNGVIFSWAER